jgi:LPXTG-motif cell wall-anchored protein
MQKLRLLIGSVATLAVLAVAGLLYIPHADAGQCLSSSVMKCGFTSVTDMRNKYNSDDTPGTKNIYTYFGITSSVVNHYTAKDGTVTKNGDVYIGNEKVATGAMTADRIDIAGSNRATKHSYNGTTFYTRTTEIAPNRAASAKVIVFLDGNGNFAGAVVYDCGNPIKGHPVPKPQPPVCACNLDTMKVETVDKSKIDNIHYTTDLSKCKPVEKVQACNLDTLKIETVDKSKIDNVHYTTDLSKCKPVEQVQACNLDTMKVEVVDKSKIDNVHYTTDLTKCAPKPETTVACNLDTFAIETVDKSKVDDVHYTTDLTKCQEQVCRVSDQTIITINKSDFDNSKYTTDLSKCESTPTTPVVELPHTGVSDGIMSVLGAGSLVGVTGAYIASRRNTR